jgi:uncharacterized membrane protein YjjB (DUF3815 family)
VLTTTFLLAALLVIGFFARTYSRRTRFLMLLTIVFGIFLLVRG